MLDDQGEQLEKFEKGVDGINADMRLAEQALRSMDLLCGIFPKFWKKSGGFKEDDAVWGEQKVRSTLFYLPKSDTMVCFQELLFNYINDFRSYEDLKKKIQYFFVVLVAFVSLLLELFSFK